MARCPSERRELLREARHQHRRPAGPADAREHLLDLGGLPAGHDRGRATAHSAHGLHQLARGLDRATAEEENGTVGGKGLAQALDGTDLATLDEDARARFRRSRVGFVFQSFQLIPTLTARENVQVPLELSGADDSGARADALLQRVGLAERSHHYPAQLSGGEQQRVAVARAFSTRPRVLFADEPTGNLDAANGAIVIDTMIALNAEYGTTLVLVTHDIDLAAHARRTLRLVDGSIVADRRA